MTTRFVVRLVASLVLLVAFDVAVAHATTTGPRPNILWIIAEDMGPQMGVYGTPEARTPNIDALAARGMVFDRAFATAPICSISRSALFTGMHAISIGAHQHRTPNERKKPLPEGVRLLTDRLRDVGYTTALVEQIAAPRSDNEIVGSRKTDWNFLYAGKPYDLNDFNELNKRQPFFAQVQFGESHRGAEWDTAHRHLARPADPEKVLLPPYYPDHPVARADWAQYLNAVMRFDQKVGYVLERLEEEGLADSTIVMVFADHGQAMPRGKQWLYDTGLAVPLIVYWPKAIAEPAGYERARTKRLVSLIDVTATTLNIAGIDCPILMQGRPLFGRHQYHNQYLFSARDRADETIDRIRSVRDERFRYIRNYMPDRPWSQSNLYKETSYPILRLMFRLAKDGVLPPASAALMAPTRAAEELYDLNSDPHEINNLADNPYFAVDLARLRGALSAWEESSNDQGRFIEPAGIADAIRAQGEKKSLGRIQEIQASEGPWR